MTPFSAESLGFQTLDQPLELTSSLPRSRKPHYLSNPTEEIFETTNKPVDCICVDYPQRIGEAKKFCSECGTNDILLICSHCGVRTCFSCIRLVRLPKNTNDFCAPCDKFMHGNPKKHWKTASHARKMQQYVGHGHCSLKCEIRKKFVWVSAEMHRLRYESAPSSALEYFVANMCVCLACGGLIGIPTDKWESKF